MTPKLKKQSTKPTLTKLDTGKYLFGLRVSTFSERLLRDEAGYYITFVVSAEDFDLLAAAVADEL